MQRDARGDVSRVAVVLGAKVAQRQRAVAQLAVVGRARVSVVERGAISPGRRNGHVRGQAAAALGCCRVQERRLEVILAPSGLRGAHRRDVRRGGDCGCVAHHRELGIGFVHAQARHDVMQRAEGAVLEAELQAGRQRGQVGGRKLEAAVRVAPLHHVQPGRRHGAQHLAELVRVRHGVHVIARLKPLRAVDVAAPHRVLRRVTWHAQRRRARGQLQHAVAAGLRHAESPLKERLPEHAAMEATSAACACARMRHAPRARLLPEDVLAVGVVLALLLAALRTQRRGHDG